MTGRTLTVVSPGPLSTVQDQGRPGLAHLGVGRSGAADLPSLSRANRLVGNDIGAAGIEMTLGGLRLRFDADVVVALAGAPCEVLVDGNGAAFGAPIPVKAGQDMRCRTPRTGVRTYLAVDGGLDLPTVLGSRSTDTLSGLGPEPLARGMSLPLGTPSASPLTDIRALDDPAPSRITSGAQHTSLALVPGPREDWFSAEAVALLYGMTWSVTPQADRIGVRLAGPPLTRREQRELPSEPMVAGAVQVPPDGQPIVFLADHPVTGGYPVIGALTSVDLPRAAQLRPGQPVAFRRSG